MIYLFASHPVIDFYSLPRCGVWPACMESSMHLAIGEKADRQSWLAVWTLGFGAEWPLLVSRNLEISISILALILVFGTRVFREKSTSWHVSLGRPCERSTAYTGTHFAPKQEGIHKRMEK